MTEKPIIPTDVVYARQVEGLNGVVAALKNCSGEERVRILSSVVVMYDLDEEVGRRLRRFR